MSKSELIEQLGVQIDKKRTFREKYLACNRTKNQQNNGDCQPMMCLINNGICSAKTCPDPRDNRITTPKLVTLLVTNGANIWKMLIKLTQ